MLGLYGNFTASDKWVIIWALNQTPQYIRYINPEGIQSLKTSGRITLSILQRELCKFKREHHYTQLSLFDQEPKQ